MVDFPVKKVNHFLLFVITLLFLFNRQSQSYRRSVNGRIFNFYLFGSGYIFDRGGDPVCGRPFRKTKQNISVPARITITDLFGFTIRQNLFNDDLGSVNTETVLIKNTRFNQNQSPLIDTQSQTIFEIIGFLCPNLNVI
jgi:hypothetical protein